MMIDDWERSCGLVRTSRHLLFTIILHQSRIILPKWLASSAYGRSEISPPMNRHNPAPRRMARGYGSRGGTEDSDSALNRLFSALEAPDALGRLSEANGRGSISRCSSPWPRAGLHVSLKAAA